jgi:hypothetical protein
MNWKSFSEDDTPVCLDLELHSLFVRDGRCTVLILSAVSLPLVTDLWTSFYTASGLHCRARAGVDTFRRMTLHCDVEIYTLAEPVHRLVSFISMLISPMKPVLFFIRVCMYVCVCIYIYIYTELWFYSNDYINRCLEHIRIHSFIHSLDSSYDMSIASTKTSSPHSAI